LAETAAVLSRMLSPVPLGLETASNCPSHTTDAEATDAGDRMPAEGAGTVNGDLAPVLGPGGPGRWVVPEADAASGLTNAAARSTKTVVIAKPSFRIRTLPPPAVDSDRQILYPDSSPVNLVNWSSTCATKRELVAPSGGGILPEEIRVV
jgi:hypothetical protein